MPVAAYLRECGYRVIEAVDSEEALTVLQHKPDVDVVLADVGISGTLDGFALAKWLREFRPNVKTILSGSPKKAATAAGDLCADGPMLKRPYDPQTLETAIKRMLGAHQGASEALRQIGS